MRLNKIHNEDCLETMAKMPENFVDLIITSPPYEDFGGAGYGGKSKDILFLKLYSDFMDKVFTHYLRVLKDTGQIFFNVKSKTFNKKLNTPHWFEFLESFRKFKLKSYIIWKYSGSFDSTNKRFHLDYEIIYHLSKTDDIFLNLESTIDDPLSSVWYVPHYIKKDERLHPTQMPLKLADRILEMAAQKNNIVYDSFMGVGTTAVACINKNIDYIGSEINEDNYIKALSRIEKAQTQKKLFHETN